MDRKTAGASQATKSAAKQLTFVFVLALAIRLFFSFFYSWQADDAIGYDTLARNLIAGHGFSLSPNPPFAPTLYRTPIYPYFLVVLYKLFGFGDFIVHFTQAIIGSVTCCLAYVIARRYWAQRVAFLAALLNAVYPFAVRFVAVKLSETVFTFLMCCAIGVLVYAYQKRSVRWMAFAGAMHGVAILCRPEVVLFPPFLLALFLLLQRFRRKWLMMGLALVACSVLVTVPWLVRNYHVTGKLTPLVKYGPGVAFWQSTIPYFDWNTFQYAPGSEQHDPIVRDLLYTPMTEAERTAMEPRMWRAGFENVRRDPVTYLSRRIRNYPHLWISGGDYLLGSSNRSFSQARAEGKYGLILIKLVLLGVLGILPLVLAVIGLIINRGRLIEMLPLWSLGLYIGLFRIPFDYAPRNTLPVHPYLLMFAACAALYFWDRFRKRPTLQS